MGERHVRNVEVRGSIPLGSTIKPAICPIDPLLSAFDAVHVGVLPEVPQNVG